MGMTLRQKIERFIKPQTMDGGVQRPDFGLTQNARKGRFERLEAAQGFEIVLAQRFAQGFQLLSVQRRR